VKRFKVFISSVQCEFDAPHDTTHDNGQPADQVTDQVTDPINELIKRLAIVLFGEMSLQELMDILDLKHKPNFRANYIKPSRDFGIVEMTDPENPNSPQQRYFLTPKGIELKKKLGEKK